MTIVTFIQCLREQLMEHSLSCEFSFQNNNKIDFTMCNKSCLVVCQGYFKYIEGFCDNVVSVVSFVSFDIDFSSAYLYNALRYLLKSVYDIMFYEELLP